MTDQTKAGRDRAGPKRLVGISGLGVELQLRGAAKRCRTAHPPGALSPRACCGTAEKGSSLDGGEATGGGCEEAAEGGGSG